MRTAQHGKKTLERNAVKRKPGRRAIIEGEAQPHGLATIPLPHCCELLWSDYLLGAQLLCGFVLQVATAFVDSFRSAIKNVYRMDAAADNY